MGGVGVRMRGVRWGACSAVCRNRRGACARRSRGELKTTSGLRGEVSGAIPWGGGRVSPRGKEKQHPSTALGGSTPYVTKRRRFGGLRASRARVSLRDSLHIYTPPGISFGLTRHPRRVAVPCLLLCRRCARRSLSGVNQSIKNPHKATHGQGKADPGATSRVANHTP